jgi:1-deoxy-D-xylulose-5-phosphate reductoisomerase
MGSMTTAVTILGSSGSIGINTLDVVARHRDRFHVSAMSAFNNVKVMLGQCRQFQPRRVVMVDADSAAELEAYLHAEQLDIRVDSGDQALSEIAAEDSGIVVCGIVGAAGLLSVIAAVKAGKKVLIANKEPLVMMGDHIVELAQFHGACLLPLDSEHNAIFQCLPQQELTSRNGRATISHTQGVKRILLTGSGGPFRTLPLEMMSAVTPDQACAHPNWDMGRKISVDSATMMNKGLELIEACALFSVPHSKIEIVIHPQSVIHSMVEYVDGSILAQMGSPDMRVPIANALAWPQRIESGATRLNVTEIARFDFEAPDEVRFPALRLARLAAESGGALPAIMNAANEVAVEAFLNGRINFDKISEIVETTMNKMSGNESDSVDAILEADREARADSKALIRDRFSR